MFWIFQSAILLIILISKRIHVLCATLSQVLKCLKGGGLKVNDDDLVTDMKEKPENPESNWLSPPFYIYAKVDVSLIGKGN